MRAFVVTLLVLAAVLVGADFGARAITEDRVADQLQTSLRLPSTPSVDVNGFPFLTQAIAGRYDDVGLSAEHIPYGKLQDITLTAQLSGVSLPLSSLFDGRVDALPTDTVVASARVNPVDLARVLDVPQVTVSPVTQAEIDQRGVQGVDPADSVRLGSSTTILGQQIGFSVIASFRLSRGQIVLTGRDTAIEAGDGPLASLAGAAIRARLPNFSVRVDPGQLPFGITPTEMHAEDGVLVVSGTARDVDLLRPQS